ncbi:hypothetical protein EMQ25_16080 [Arsenicitalea aurantiaca]|uniref:Uncharacterized protein n=1 Tax=Arsenicitalea aurantiaca TaxID=1783274 RepID=A0A433X364_9HYPH|nr:hypothetical protein [Arsenicitalea aurantiaca]RUT28499.1 hypothetical protein EMQ25_16080 [Arsenicitalea aurantiaca]
MTAIGHALLAARHELYELAWANPTYLAYVHQHRLDPGALAAFAGATATLSVVDCGNGRFDWEAPGDRLDVFVCEALDADGEATLDLVAWPLNRPSHVLTMFGRAPLLGLWEAMNPATYFMGKSLVMHRTPLDWLKSGCSGAVILNSRLAARLFLDIEGSIAARDQAHARELVQIARSVVDERRIVVAVGDAARAA